MDAGQPGAAAIAAIQEPNQLVERFVWTSHRLKKTGMRPLEVSPHLVRALDNVHKIITKLSVAGASDGRSKTRTDRDRVRAAGAVVDMMRAAPTWRAGPSSATEWFESDSYSATVTMCPSHGT